ncbi:hypothetical protein, variant 1 [Phytophthora nicotianae INRA-310]|uniref:Crinkler effector protein N-terminal domain-containing protein n=1 Tax=Phytophthora nicotianae (strain INRA-310) TaxID=761204 RepID=W2QWR2_PHYN3|nr:hypothetical protein, variant 1 [Phytophthora nicotianae INRA-310]ETN16715.1 hypothetical protein, variant 1 [Phytophthora nicotianae INRA-310]
MVLLNCALVGVGSVISIIIEEWKTVALLKDAIKAKKPDTIKGEADNLQLSLAKKGEGWLPIEDLAAIEDGVAVPGFEKVSLVDTKRVKYSAYSIQKVLQMKGLPSPQTEQIHVLVVVPEQTQGQPRLWLVTGSVDNALNTKGIRCRLYWMATLRIGYYDPVRRTPDKNVAFWYEGKKLCFHVLFKTEDAALLFETDLRTGPQTLGSPLYDQVVETRVAQINAVSAELQRVFYADYVPEESESQQNTISSVSLTTSVSNLDTSTDEFEYQRIERKNHFVPYGKAESCHLVSRKQSRDHKREFAKYDRDPNNRLALSRDMHGWYDGMSIEFPIVNMLPGSVDKNSSIGNRRKVEVFVKVVDAQCTDRVFSRLKEGSTKTDDPLVMKTFVHVEDPETFCFCMRWKYDDNDKRQRSFFDMTPAVD